MYWSHVRREAEDFLNNIVYFKFAPKISFQSLEEKIESKTKTNMDEEEIKNLCKDAHKASLKCIEKNYDKKSSKF